MYDMTIGSRHAFCPSEFDMLGLVVYSGVIQSALGWLN
jgi:hypothetical protein